MISRIFSVVLILLSPLMDEFTLLNHYHKRKFVHQRPQQDEHYRENPWNHELLRVRGVDYRGFPTMFGGIDTVYCLSKIHKVRSSRYWRHNWVTLDMRVRGAGVWCDHLSPSEMLWMLCLPPPRAIIMSTHAPRHHIQAYFDKTPGESRSATTMQIIISSSILYNRNRESLKVIQKEVISSSLSACNEEVGLNM